jgi:hypothetical protein
VPAIPPPRAGLKKETINAPEHPPGLIRSFGMEVTTRSQPGGRRSTRTCRHAVCGLIVLPAHKRCGCHS